MDHPRSRGVYARPHMEPWRGTGSSPLARGLPVDVPLKWDVAGIIPARAGFTCTRINRACPTAGSSPLARGLLSATAADARSARIIPARAGFTGPNGPSPATSLDHPRSRGVYAATPRMAARMVGSSPLARGLRRGNHQGFAVVGIIPARAGFTSASEEHLSRSGDHPRSRGVYSSVPFSRCAPTGSSPLARGLRGTTSSDTRGTRIIPARAGFTSGRPAVFLQHWDHPRSRGVYDEFWDVVLRNLRIIPARAGFT